MIDSKVKNPPFVPLWKRGIEGDFRIRGFIAALALLLAPGVALAQGGYGALSYFDWSVEHTGLPEIESAGIRAVGGYKFSDIFSIEGHAATGGTDDIEFPGGLNAPEDAEAELNKMVAGFAKLNLPLLNNRVNVFGLAGYAYARVDILAETTATAESQNSFAWGAGADVALIPDRLYLTADYIDYISRTGYEASAASLGLRLSFSGQ